MRPSRHPMNLTKSKNMQMNPEKLPTVEQAERELKRLRHRKAYRRALRGTISVLIVVAAISVLIATLFLPVLQIAGVMTLIVIAAINIDRYVRPKEVD